MTFDERYFSRQLVLRDFGAAAQERLSRSRVLVAGLGGTGSVVATSLSLAGVGRISLVDRDVVSVENLHRQPIYSPKDVGLAKAEVAADYLSGRVKGLVVDYTAENLDRGNAPALLDGADLAVDCLDSMEARLALNAACAAAGVPMVHTGAIGWESSVATFWARHGPCMECVFPDSHARLPSCDEVGVLGAVTSVAGSLGALEAVKLLAGTPSSLLGKMLYFDGRSLDFRLVGLRKREDCGVCGTGSKRNSGEAAIRLCGSEEFYLTKVFPRESFSSLASRLSARARTMGDSVILLKEGRVEMSLFRSGNVLVKGVPSADEASGAVGRLLATVPPEGRLRVS